MSTRLIGVGVGVVGITHPVLDTAVDRGRLGRSLFDETTVSRDRAAFGPPIARIRGRNGFGTEKLWFRTEVDVPPVLSSYR